MSDSWLTEMKFLGSFLGVLCGLCYVHVAWYNRDNSKGDFKEFLKIKVLFFLLPLCLPVYFDCFSLLTQFFPLLNKIIPFFSQFDAQESKAFAIFYMIFLCATASLIILIMCLYAHRCGLMLSSIPAESRELAIRCASETFFHGISNTVQIMAEKMPKLHLDSKCNLIHFMPETYKLLSTLDQDRNSNKLAFFRSKFNSVIGILLYQFFQHDNRAHPDFCATYYRYDPQSSSKPLVFIARVSGGGNYHASSMTILGPRSLAMRCLKEGKILHFPNGKNGPRRDTLIPPLSNKQIKQFVVLPVPCEENLSFKDRCGVLCIDTCLANAWQLSEKFHLSLLEWSTCIVSELHKEILANGGPTNELK